MATAIEWCDETINPVVGCTKCSPGCRNCYAERWAEKLSRNPAVLRKYYGVVDQAGRWSGQLNFDLAAFDKLPKRTPRTVFLASMGDVFHENVPQAWIDQIWNRMSLMPQHRFLVLTKRPARMRAALADLARRWKSEVFGPAIGGPPWPLANVWLGATVCNQAEADTHLPELLATAAAGRFISVEPMLAMIKVDRWLRCKCPAPGFLDPRAFANSHSSEKLDWVIVGGETGEGARPMHPDWVRSLRDQCQAAGVPFFFKGWGKFSPDFDGSTRFTNCRSGAPMDQPAPMYRLGKKKSGRLLDDLEHNERPW